MRVRRGGAAARGSGTVLMAGVMGVVGVLFVVALLVAGYLVAAHRARGAADLAALSGAGRYQQGGDPCAAAGRTAAANGARVTSCDRVGDRVGFVVSVTVVVDVRALLPGLPRTVAARAHAGPVHEGG
jgi:secretion/DNA translocation related TadE-like protein